MFHRNFVHSTQACPSSSSICPFFFVFVFFFFFSSSAPSSSLRFLIFFFVDESVPFSCGGTNSFCLAVTFSTCFSRCCSSLLSFTALSLACLPKKYSPLSICRSILLFSWGGGNGVYGFLLLSVILRGFFLLLKVLFLKWGKKRSQFSFFSSGSFVNSLLI